MTGTAVNGATFQNSAAVRGYRPNDTYDYPHLCPKMLKSIKCDATKAHRETAARTDKTYTYVRTFTSEKHEVYTTCNDGEDFDHSMQQNEAYVATCTRDFEHSMQINESYITTPTINNEDFEHSMRYRYEDDEIYENYVINSLEPDKYSYIRHVHRKTYN